MVGGPRKGSEPNRVSFLDCNEQASLLVLVTDAVQAGIVPKNKCGDQKAVPHPGEIVFWALPRPFWDFQ